MLQEMALLLLTLLVWPESSQGKERQLQRACIRRTKPLPAREAARQQRVVCLQVRVCLQHRVMMCWMWVCLCRWPRMRVH